MTRFCFDSSFRTGALLFATHWGGTSAGAAAADVAWEAAESCVLYGNTDSPDDAVLMPQAAAATALTAAHQLRLGQQVLLIADHQILPYGMLPEPPQLQHCVL